MIKNLTNKKKKGFTLVELVVVIAIIAILAAVLVPQIAGYIEEARKTEVIQEAREIITAVESVNTRQAGAVANADTWTNLQANAAITNLVPAAGIDTIPGGATVQNLRDILDTENFTFEMNGGDLDPSTIANF